MRRVAWVSVVAVVLALPAAAPASAVDPTVTVHSTQVRMDALANTWEGQGYECDHRTTMQDATVASSGSDSCSSAGVPGGEEPLGTSSTEYTLDRLSTGGSLTRVRWDAVGESAATWGQETMSGASTLTILTLVVDVANGEIPLSIDATLHAVTNSPPEFDGGTAAHLEVYGNMGAVNHVWTAGDTNDDDVPVEQVVTLPTGRHAITLTTASSAGTDFSGGLSRTSNAASHVELWFGERNEVAIDNVTLTEGNSGTKPFTFTASRPPAGPAGSVFYVVVGVEAKPGSDFIADEGTLDFAAGQESKTLSVQVQGDRLREPNERFRVLLTEADLAISDGIGVGRINNDDACDNLYTAGADTITGTSAANVLCGGGGADRIEGRGGNDVILGGAGGDTLLGGDGRDTINGGDDNDVLRGGVDADTIDGGAGVDTGYGDGGGDKLDGKAGADTLYGGDGEDTFRDCDTPVDHLNGGKGADTAAAHSNAVVSSIETRTGC